jgi:hypothetical protein
MSHLTRFVTEVTFEAPGAMRTSLRVTTLTPDPAIIRQEAVHKAAACYGLHIINVQLGNQFIL